MTGLLLGILTSFVVALIATRVVRGFALRFGHVDVPDERKRHAGPIPHLGGIGIAAGLFAGLLVAALTPGVVWADVWPLFLGAGVITVLGIWDDLRGLGFKRRIFVQLVTAYAMVLSGWYVDVASMRFFDTLSPFVQAAISLPLTMLWVIGLINAVNFMDGLDGNAAGVALVAFVSLGVAYFSSGDPLLLALCGCAAAASVGFLVFNVPPASIFMGDTGSTLLGFLLAMAGLRGIDNTPTLGLLAVPVVALALPILDTTTATLRRVANGDSPFLPDADHLHHRMRLVMGSDLRAMLGMWAVGAAFGVIANVLQLANGSDVVQALCLLAAALVAYRVVRRLGYVRVRVLWRQAQRRRTNRLRTVKRVALQQSLVAGLSGDGGVAGGGGSVSGDGGGPVPAAPARGVEA